MSNSSLDVCRSSPSALTADVQPSRAFVHACMQIQMWCRLTLVTALSACGCAQTETQSPSAGAACPTGNQQPRVWAKRVQGSRPAWVLGVPSIVAAVLCLVTSARIQRHRRTPVASSRRRVVAGWRGGARRRHSKGTACTHRATGGGGGTAGTDRATGGGDRRHRWHTLSTPLPV